VATAGSVTIPVVPDFSAFPEVARLDLRPGDRLVLTFPQRLTAEESDWVAERLRGAWDLPESVRVVVLDGGATLTVASEARQDET
jgi:hypothetical protein